ncbi:MAG TPA: PEP-CTERM sorting domain-containing protein [Acidovorax sp.]
MEFKTAAAIVAGMLLSATAHAVPIVNTNVRPVALGATAAGEQSLQTVLDNVFGAGAVSAANDQSAAGLWGSATSSATTIPTLIIEQTSGASSQKFGMWFGTDTSNIYTVDLFFGGAVGGSTTLQQSAVGIGIGNGQMIISAGPTFQSQCGTQVNCGLFSNALINPTSFGFYFATGAGKTAYSIDSMNLGGATDFLAFQGGTSTNWIFAFEDGTDNDFQDMAVKVESITVPEPGSLALLGLALAGAVAVSRRKSKQD